MKLTTIEAEVVVDVTPEKAWDILADYGNVASFLTQIEDSKSINGSQDRAALDGERRCTLPSGKKKILLSERITDIVDGEYYTYDVYDWENLPLKTMHNTFGVRTNNQGETTIYQRTEYRLSPGFLTYLMKGKLRAGAREALLGYKHYMETGEKNVDIKILKKKYKDA